MGESGRSFLYGSMSTTCSVGVVSKLFELLHAVGMQMTVIHGFQKIRHHLCFIVKQAYLFVQLYVGIVNHLVQG